jgi:hypothetical protein
MVFHPERRILWHPRHATKFAVGGSAAITLYDYSEEKPAIRHVTSHDDLQHMRVSRVIRTFFCARLLE